MGSINAFAAYRMWGEKLNPTSMLVLIYMAMTSLDADEYPWFGRGQAHLAVYALNRPDPPSKADIQAVERAIRPMLSLGAIVTDRRAAVRVDGPSTARYRLNLGSRAERHALRKTEYVTDQDQARPSESEADAPHFSVSRPSKNGPTPFEKRSTEEPLGGFEEKRGATPSGPPLSRGMDGGGIASQAEKIIDRSVPDLGHADRAKLLPAIVEALTAGHTEPVIRDELGKPTAGLNDLGAGLASRVRKLPPPKPKTEHAPECGECEKRFVEYVDVEGTARMAYCPRCHPLRDRSPAKGQQRQPETTTPAEAPTKRRDIAGAARNMWSHGEASDEARKAEIARSMGYCPACYIKLGQYIQTGGTACRTHQQGDQP